MKKDFVPTENPRGASDEEQSYHDLEVAKTEINLYVFYQYKL